MNIWILQSNFTYFILKNILLKNKECHSVLTPPFQFPTSPSRLSLDTCIFINVSLHIFIPDFQILFQDADIGEFFADISTSCKAIFFITKDFYISIFYKLIHIVPTEQKVQ